MDLAEHVYRIADQMPERERYGLVSQMTRSAVSVPANIAEGHARSTRRDFANFISIAKGSLMETETYLLLVLRLDLANKRAVGIALDLVTEISKMLTALRNRLLN